MNTSPATSHASISPPMVVSFTNPLTSESASLPSPSGNRVRRGSNPDLNVDAFFNNPMLNGSENCFTAPSFLDSKFLKQRTSVTRPHEITCSRSPLMSSISPKSSPPNLLLHYEQRHTSPVKQIRTEDRPAKAVRLIRAKVPDESPEDESCLAGRTFFATSIPLGPALIEKTQQPMQDCTLPSLLTRIEAIERKLSDLIDKVDLLGVGDAKIIEAVTTLSQNTHALIANISSASFATMWCEISNKRYKYQGMCINGVPNGVGSAYDLNNTCRYDGSWVSGLPEGNGTSFDEQGDKCYSGEWLAGGECGFGQFFDSDGVLLYEGQWRDRKFHGFGIAFSRGVKAYEGNWECGKRTGDGIEYITKANETSTDNDHCESLLVIKYRGSWKDDKRHGFGTDYDEASGEAAYEGHWMMNLKSGSGKLFHNDTGAVKYEGDWVNDQFHGVGTLYYNIDEAGHHFKCYDGCWKEGKADGRGSSYHQESGTVFYTGEWKDGIPHGHGTTFFKDHQTIQMSGHWINGSFTY